MNYRLVIYLLGKVMMFLSLFLLLPCLVALIYSEWAGIFFLATSVGCLVLGWLMSRKKPKNTGFYAREGFVVVALSWIMLSFLGAIPFWASGE
ncbi:MAG: TrkH family potassium uptake protein, partial [Lachnospiraceae bacterium]|nr:TrkH family potassium uptake protein [Lachnospiraceae bacterium]